MCEVLHIEAFILKTMFYQNNVDCSYMTEVELPSVKFY